MKEKEYELIIIGTGPAGYSAAIYAARAGINVLQISGNQIGGQLTSTNDIENYPGVKSTSGIDLMDQMQNQVKSLGVETLYDTVTSLEKIDESFKIGTEYSSFLSSKSVIIATGANPKKLDIKGEEDFWAKGVSSCATCDGFFCKEKRVIVVGGGNTAVEDALFLTNFATSVTLIHRKDSLRAEKSLQDRLFKNPKINILWNTELKEIIGNQNKERVGGVNLINNITQKETKMEADHIFIAIGYIPNSEIFKNLVICDKDGYIVTNDTHTNINGLFAAGDVTNTKYKQAIIASGNGAFASLEAQKYLENI